MRLSSLRMFIFFLFVASGLCIVLLPAAYAQAVYTYQGNLFNSFQNGGACPPDCSLYGYFSLAEPLPPNINPQNPVQVWPVPNATFWFTGGSLAVGVPCDYRTIICPDRPTTSLYVYKTDASGNVVEWNLELFTPCCWGDLISWNYHLGTDFLQLDGIADGSGDSLASNNSPGAWTKTVSTPLSITTSSLPSGMVGSTYTQGLAATGGTPPYAWSIPSGILPLGLSLAGSTISGTPTSPGIFNFTVQVTDSAGGTASLPLGIQIGNISAPTSLKASQLGCSSQTGCPGTQIQLTWDYGNDPVDGFVIDRQTVSEHKGGIWPEQPILVSPANCVPSTTGLTCTYPDTVTAWATYNYRVRAYLGTDESGNSNEAICFQLNLYTDTFNSRMISKFVPGGNISDVLNAFGYDHLNWISQLTYAPVDITSDPTIWRDWSGNHLPAPPPGIIDPPSGGWYYRQADSLPYFWDEQSGFALLYSLASHTYQTYVDFNDVPGLPSISNYLAGDYYQFFTSLVGVKIVGSATQNTPLAHFSWSSNRASLFGGITDFRTSNLDPPTVSGPGGILNVQVVKNEDLPLDVRNVLIQAGAQGLSTAPKIDKDAPMTAASISGRQGTNGWYTGPVNVILITTDIDGPSDIGSTTYNVDAGSLTAYTGPFTVSGDGLHTIQFYSVDHSGNAETQQTTTIKLDQTPPTISGSRTPAANVNGWNSSAVTVSFQCADSLSGLAAGSPPAPTTLSSQGAGQSVSATCQDLAGNTSTATVAGINIDTTPPTIGITAPANGVIYAANQPVSAVYTCNDSGSGVAACVGTVPSGSKIDTAPSGPSTTKTFTVNATDVAGNPASQLVSYQVSCHYVALGISPSTVSRGGTVTVTGTIMSCTNAAQSVRVMFTLTGPLGPKSCARTSTVMFTTPSFTIRPGSSKSVSFPFFIPKSACAGPFTITTTTLVGGAPVDSTSATLIVQ